MRSSPIDLSPSMQLSPRRANLNTSSSDEYMTDEDFNITAEKDMEKFEKDSNNTTVGHTEKLIEIEEKYEALFTEMGLVRKEHTIYCAKPDGACGSNCAAIHYHQDEDLLTLFTPRGLNSPRPDEFLI